MQSKPKVLIVLTFILFFRAAAPASAQSFSKVDSWLASNIEDLGGRAYLMVYKDGNIIYSKGINHMNLREKFTYRMIARRIGEATQVEEYTPYTRQPIASCSKWLSAALVMTFVDEGKLRLSDTVGQYLPELTRYGKGNITISECLSHLTGIKSPGLKEDLEARKKLNSMEDAIRYIGAMPMEGRPGTVFHYSNEGLQIAAAVLEKISGESFQTLFQERIAKPLEMDHTDFGLGRVPLPAGGAISTTEDYMHFLEMVLQHGTYKGKRILSVEALQNMEVNRITPSVTIGYSPEGGGGYGYGFGEWTMEKGSTGSPAHLLSSPGLFGSFPWVDANKGYCAFLMTFNLNNKGRIEKYMELKALVDEALR